MAPKTSRVVKCDKCDESGCVSLRLWDHLTQAVTNPTLTLCYNVRVGDWFTVWTPLCIDNLTALLHLSLRVRNDIIISSFRVDFNGGMMLNASGTEKQDACRSWTHQTIFERAISPTIRRMVAKNMYWRFCTDETVVLTLERHGNHISPRHGL